MVPDQLIGKQLGGYLIQSQLGEGGMARVYKAYQARLRREVAIKIILSQAAEQPDFRMRFEREAQLIASLEHPNIVAVYDFGELDQLMYLVMQYIGGGTLREQLRHGVPIEPRRAAQYALQMARALHHAHQRGIVHRDVKPQNMLVSSSDPNHLLLSDFGIAKLFNVEEHFPSLLTLSPPSSQATMTSADQLLGTPTYMSPEQINRQAVDARTDVYALGAVLYHMLAGLAPFQSTTISGLLYQHVYIPLRPIRMLNPNVPEILAQITARAMEKAPEARFPTAAAMAEALEMALAALTASPASPFIGAGSPSYPPPSQPPPPYSTQGSVYTAARRGTVSPSEPSITTTANYSPPASMQPKRVRQLSVVVAVLLMIALALGYTLLHNGQSQSQSSTLSSTSQATAFVETFQDDQRSWQPSSPTNGLSATLGNQQFILTIDNVPATNYYFPYPAAVGTLPATFTLSTSVTQNQGSPSTFYGLAFRMSQDGGVVRSYAFVVNHNGQFEFLKFDPNAKIIPTVLQTGSLPSSVHLAMNQQSTIQVTVHDQSFSFAVNGTSILINGSTITTDTTSSAPYTDGQLALLVTGPNSRFTVTRVQLSLP
jgi:serine/threonine protein kinase